MPKIVRPLTALEVKRAKAPGLHFVGGVPGLALQVTDTGARSWVLRYKVGSKRRDMGLGSAAVLSLDEARKAAREARVKLLEGVDPIDEARARRSALAAESARAITFDATVSRFMDAKSIQWRNDKHRAQWLSTLSTYASSVFGKMLVSDIEPAQVLDALRPIWTTKTETASRLRGRIESVLSFAMASGYREPGLNPARWKGHLDQLLPSPKKVAPVEHFAALPYKEMTAFMARLRDERGMGAQALEFAILCAARSGEVRGATWSEIDLEEGVWTIPAARMKAAREHRVPLSEDALALLRALPRDSDLVFPSPTGKRLSDATMTALLRRMDVAVTAHGFRSAFRDWAAEQTAFPSEVVEMALAHAISNKVEAAYRRGDLFDKRRRLMEEWAAFCKAPVAGGEVVPMRATA